MNHRLWVFALALAALPGCEQRSAVTTQPPPSAVPVPADAGTSTGTGTSTTTTTTTTTTIGLTPQAQDKLSQAASDAASATGRLGEAASGAAVRLGSAASGAATRLGEAGSNLAARVEAKAPGALQSASEALGRAGDAANDAAITAKVKTAYLADTDVKGLQINVDTHDGVVLLRGTLEQRAYADKAEAIARKVAGVKSVSNQLTVKPAG